jgi:hypothetical protein
MLNPFEKSQREFGNLNGTVLYLSEATGFCAKAPASEDGRYKTKREELTEEG